MSARCDWCSCERAEYRLMDASATEYGRCCRRCWTSGVVNLVKRFARWTRVEAVRAGAVAA